MSVHVGPHVLVLDAGTGIRPLGASLLGTAHPITLLLTHVHTDHIAGFPFFAPLFEPHRPIHLIPYRHDALETETDETEVQINGADADAEVAPQSAMWTPLDLMDGRHFPLLAADIPSECQVLDASPDAVLSQYGVRLTRLAVNHPGGAWGYRLTHRGHSFVFIPDNELSAPSPRVDMERVAAFCRGADVLCHDAQYVAAEREARRGWGHSVVSDVCALARMADVGHLVLFHHDPQRSDAALDQIQARARRVLHPHRISCTAAYEGLTLPL